MKDEFEDRRKNRLLGTVRGPAKLILFPLCDSRGLVSQTLSGSTRELDGQGPENVFFAWLLGLPTGIDASAAAKAMLLVSGIADHGNEESQTKHGSSRKTMIGLLQRVGTRGSLYESAKTPQQLIVDEILE